MKLIEYVIREKMISKKDIEIIKDFKAQLFPTVLFVYGVPGSGKSTIAKEIMANTVDCINIERDNFRKTFTGSYDTTKSVGGKILNIATFSLREFIENGNDVIVSDTSLQADVIKRYLIDVKNKCNVIFHDASAGLTLDEIKTRNRQREEEKIVPENVVEDFWATYKRIPKRKNTFINFHEINVIPPKNNVNEFTEQCFIFDIDGTLAEMSGRSPFEWKRVGEDSLRKHIAEVLKAVYAAGYKVFVFSGRDSICRPETEQWLADNKLQYHGLFMRGVNDFRADFVIKAELYLENIFGKFDVVSIFDDRLQVIEMWEWLGQNVVVANKSCDMLHFDKQRLFAEIKEKYRQMLI